MRNFELHLTPPDCRRFLDSHFLTAEFRQACGQHKFLAELMDAFCKYPRLTFVPGDEANERSNFTSWYNALAVRKYVNPAVNDLYYLHEIAHIVTMPYAQGASFEVWKAKVFKNELETSVLSEAFIYLLSPDLRKLTFAGEIWVDRHLQQLRTMDLSEGLAFLLKERARIQAAVGLTDPQELRIHEYQTQNEKWADLWCNRYDEVESHMVEFYALAANHPASAIRRHHGWIQHQIQLSGKPYPFASEVEEFARAYGVDQVAGAKGNNDFIKWRQKDANFNSDPR